MSDDQKMACAAAAVFVGLCNYAPVVLAVIVFLILLGIGVFALVELIGCLAGDDEDQS